MGVEAMAAVICTFNLEWADGRVAFRSRESSVPMTEAGSLIGNSRNSIGQCLGLLNPLYVTNEHWSGSKLCKKSQQMGWFRTVGVVGIGGSVEDLGETGNGLIHCNLLV